MKRLHIRLVLLFLLCLSVTFCGLHAQNQPQGFLSAPADQNDYLPFGLSSARMTLPLNGQWDLSVDDGDTWKPVRVPSSFNQTDKLVFRRKFSLPPEAINRYHWKLVCCGIQYEARITLNNTFIGQHESSIPFTQDIPEDARVNATNTLQIETYNRLDYSSTVPIHKLLFGSRTYGGIVRDIYLVGVPKVWIENVRVRTRGGEATFDVRVVAGAMKGMNLDGDVRDTGRAAAGGKMEADRGDFEVNVVMRSADKPGDTTGRAGSGGAEAGHGAQTFALESKRTVTPSLVVNVSNPAMWSPQTPVLYQAVVQVRYQGRLVDERTVNVGFRSLIVQGGTLMLNGQPIEIKGVAYIEDSKAGGMSLSHDAMRRDMQMIRRDLGANLVLFPDGIPHPYILQVCDELGLMAQVDVPVGSPSAGLFADDVFRKRVLDRTRQMVEAVQYPCVVAYGINAVIPGNDNQAVNTVAQMRRVMDSLDKKLFIVAATSWGNPELRKVADVAGLNAFNLDPVQVRKTIVGIQAELRGEKPLMITAYGKGVQLNNRKGYRDPLSYEAQAKYISDIYNLIPATKLAGGVCWSFNDYRTDRPLMTTNNGEEDMLATTGLLTLDRQQRPAMEMLVSLYTDQKSPELPIGDYASPSPLVFVITGVLCAVIFLLLINNSRRFREDMTRSLLRPYNFYADIRDQRILSNLQTTLLCAVIATVLGIIVASLCYHYRMDERFDMILMAVLPDRLKVLLDTVIWNPWMGIVVFSVSFFLVGLAGAGLIRAFSGLVRNRVFFSDAFAIAVWGALPTLLLTPVAIVLYRLLDASNAGPIAFAVMVVVALWVLYRVLRGTAVVYDVPPMKTYLYSIGSVVALCLVLYLTSKPVSVIFSYLREGISSMYGA